MSTIADILKQEFSKRSIPFKENQTNLIVKCPICYSRDGKEKLKLYIHKETGIFHCFRCGSKGNILKLAQLLDRFYGINLFLYIDIDETIEQSFSTTFLSESLSSIDRQLVIERIKLLRKNNDVLNQVAQELKSRNDEVEKRVYGYLLKRGIPVTLIRDIPYFIGYNPKSKLYMRFGVMSFLYTNYEARTILPNIQPKYLQANSSQNVTDFIFLTPVQSNGERTLRQKDVYVNPERYVDTNIHFNEFFIVEGLFDALKLNLYLNKPVISLGGWSKYKGSLLFLKMIESLVNKFSIDRLIYLFDSDVKDTEIQKVADTILAYRNYIPTTEITFTKVKSDRYKDVGDVESPEELKHLLKQALAV